MLTRARTEFEEELGMPAPAAANWIELGSVKQKGGKTVHAWAFEGNLPDALVIASNTFELEWPPRSGRIQQFPEIDRAEFFRLRRRGRKSTKRRLLFSIASLKRCRRDESKAAFPFAPGAGAPSSHPWMRAWAERLDAIGNVRTFDYDYMREGRRRPDPPPLLIAAHRQALREARKDETQPVILIGKSMGGRIGCHVALEESVAGLVCLGYPLCGAGDPKRLRDKVLRDLRTPILFVQGTRDPLCPLDLLESVRKEMKAPNFLHIVEGGDHSLLVTKSELRRTSQTQQQIDAQILAAVASFVNGLDANTADPSS